MFFDDFIHVFCLSTHKVFDNYYFVEYHLVEYLNIVVVDNYYLNDFMDNFKFLIDLNIDLIDKHFHMLELMVN